MLQFTEHEGIAVPLDSANVDTDQIIPKQFLLSVSRQGFGAHLFHDLRYLDDAETMPNPEFSLNQPCYRGATILVARDNFGSGSSREHAPWALLDYGFRAVIAPSFADIYNNNALGCGLLNVRLQPGEVDQLFACIYASPGIRIRVSLVEQTVQAGSLHFAFTLDPYRRQCLLEGLDHIALTLKHEDQIAAYEQRMPGCLRPHWN